MKALMSINSTKVYINEPEGFDRKANFVIPDFNNLCFSKIPDTIKGVFKGQSYEKALPESVLPKGIKEYQNVILLFVDAFGWRFLNQFKNENKTLIYLNNEATITKLTAQFPSTTAAHVTTIHTGVPVYEHGIYEWFYYEPIFNKVITPLKFSEASSDRVESLLGEGYNISDILPKNTLYLDLKELGVSSFVYHPAQFSTKSSHEKVVCNGSSIVPYKDLKVVFTEIAHKITNSNQKNYFYLYYPNIDSAGHDFGFQHINFSNQINTFFNNLQELINSLPRDGKTLLLLTADHGQIEVSPDTTIYLDRIWPEIFDYMQLLPNSNQSILPTGGSRDCFLHVKPECEDIVVNNLKLKLKDHTLVLKTSKLLKLGFFSDNPSQQLKSRLGNIAILPYANQTIWWSMNGKFDMKFLGHHGGLSPEEMEIPLICLEC
jgi:predicted AlkP superfamily pyrophosphatase or phosphodiesterase